MCQLLHFLFSTLYINGSKHRINMNLIIVHLLIINCCGFLMCLLDELLLPHMRKIDGMLNDNRKRLLSKLRLDHAFKVFSFKFQAFQSGVLGKSLNLHHVGTA